MNFCTGISMKLLRFLFVICMMQSFGVSAQSNELHEKFIKGELRYDCSLFCQVTLDLNRGPINDLYRNKDWSGLVKKMDEIGLQSRNTYFSLFKAAEELEHYDAAKIYLELAKSSKMVLGCNLFNRLDMCEEMSRIQYRTVRKKNLPSDRIEEEKVKVADTSSESLQVAQPAQVNSLNNLDSNQGLSSAKIAADGLLLNKNAFVELCKSLSSSDAKIECMENLIKQLNISKPEVVDVKPIQQQRRVESSGRPTDKWLSKSESELIKAYGVPVRSYESGSVKYLTYFFDEGTMANRAVAINMTCEYTFNLENNMVFKVDQKGYGCPW
jgi:hypothetical protein